MMNSLSITGRLLLGLSGATLLFWISVPTIAALSLSKVVNEDSDYLLELTATSYENVMIDVLNGTYEAGNPGHIPSFNRFRAYTMVVRNPAGDARIFPPAMGLPKRSPNLREGFSQTATDRIYTMRMADGNFIEVAEPLDIRRRLIRKRAVLSFLPLLVLLPVSIAIWWMVIRGSLAPIEGLRKEIGTRDGRNLSPLRLSDLPAELVPIAASADRLLERLRTALDAERESAANIAHELRTPIAGSLAQMQRLLAELPQGSAKARARGIEESLLNLGSRVGKLLQLARAESGIGIADIAADLVRAVRLESEDFGNKPEYAGRLILDVDGCLSLMRYVDIDACGIILRNLIENALKHGPPDTAVTVSVRPDGTIAIANAGAVVSIQDLEEITERFSRGATRASGSGLGLHIATMLIERIGGSLELVSPRRGREDGFEAIVRIPR
ncbi:two-component sensor histidine kinase [Sinorhizobium medicae]|uniref:sensor histidine kinase n=1 Tax=Sinorhizobium medicae TaxID=110321 RepID=UPI001294EDA3|nr:HAMP domain-containing sensor histidine kinase [Sinorhizobium medicae]MDX2388430.1 two-component sensor histidine kinase [Sinorhizobium medicae]MQU76570.1 two-component sensor histidine kinase [Sinorhizobium medicae]